MWEQRITKGKNETIKKTLGVPKIEVFISDFDEDIMFSLKKTFKNILKDFFTALLIKKGLKVK